MGIVTCPHCQMRVLPKMDGTCPSCQVNIQEEQVNTQEEQEILGNYFRGIVDELGGRELLGLVVKRIRSPLDNSFEGIVKAFSYYSIVHARLVKFINLTKQLEDLIVTKGRPSVFGKGRWDKEVSSLLHILDQQTQAIFGEKIGLNSINEVPDGCGKVWFYFLALFVLADDIKFNTMNFITRKDPFGIQKAIQIFDAMAEKGNELVKARDALLMEIKNSGFDLETISHRARELIRVSKK
jgi:hypothetical protein